MKSKSLALLFMVIALALTCEGTNKGDSAKTEKPFQIEYIESKDKVKISQKDQEPMWKELKPLLDAEWRKIETNSHLNIDEPPSVLWVYEVSLPIPSKWPPGSGLKLYYYVSARGHDVSGGLADAHYVAGPWARVEIGADGSSPRLGLLAKEIKEIGIQGVRMLEEKEVILYGRWAGGKIETYLSVLSALPDEASLEVIDFKRFFCSAISLNWIYQEIQPIHQDFFDWLSCK